MKLYKLTRQDYTTYNDTLWGKNVTHEAYGEGKTYPYKYSDDKSFDTPENHYQWLAHEYGPTNPAARILYKDGRTVEIFKKSKEAA